MHHRYRPISKNSYVSIAETERLGDINTGGDDRGRAVRRECLQAGCLERRNAVRQVHALLDPPTVCLPALAG